MKTLIATLALSLMALASAFSGVATAQTSPQQSAQDTVWIQIAARASLREAQAEAQEFAARLPDVSGFALGGGWYGIVLGPYARNDADRVLQVYRAERQIPRDSFIAFGRNLGNQFYPTAASANTETQPTVESPVLEPIDPAVVTEAPADPTASAQTLLPDETPAEARRSESRLTREERKDLQIALKAAGFYTSTIDGAFGRGTRGSMSDWQSARGYAPTGVLTTAQRQALMDEYNAPLISVGMAPLTDTKAGIALNIPAGEVTFDRYESPFALFKSSGDLGAQVLLISQPGDKRTLYGLYDIMQTLKIVPLDGPRQRSGNSFTLEGRGNGIVSYTEARLANGEIKGFTLVWPMGDDDRRARVLAEMQNSFERIDGVLDPAAGADAPQNVDLVSGLDVRKPRLSRSGFYVDAKGSVVTTSDVVAGCARVTLDHEYQAEVAFNDSAAGIAVLRPVEPLAPMAVAALASASARLQSDIAVSGFSYEGVLGAPSLSWGSLQDVKDLSGNTGVARLQLTSQPGDAGGPVLTTDGAVQGMLLSQSKGATQLPDGVSFAANADSLRSALSSAGVTVTDASAGATALPVGALTRQASGMTVLVSCWE
ncbi:Trypsin-like serine protease, typically periplasmic [Phaeobacter piscinae]|uniref:Trypsin-like serine protease, typically periplasmic n=1 Tax=Phaeobacter piscinae TaxID=1580596 RepID=A0ABN5DBM1_9RHOB|nr:serine protease [Phaeobacter piscinae]ATG34736.1 Trypsin-like serine protease, typically periplasmic [Phaeobacter piscinae]AUQ85256.1 Trypsin-like serine protease, typically periplasmic [Phaeobacter piscinae]AUR23140.1 Trypsin-like serine protease, typically periplasmic [Phaeobacter piscinae]